jgi:hypothetical protein
MTVINTTYDYLYGEPGQCTLCNERLRYPFLQWDSIPAHLCICGECCRKIKSGFIADLIQVVAIMEIRSLGGRDYSGYYANARLVRRSRADLEAEGARREAEMVALSTRGAVPLMPRQK